jgi:hypothetical protein
MKIHPKALLVPCIAACLAACGGNPAGPAASSADAVPRESGHTLGGGSRVDDPTQTAAAPTGTTTVIETTAARGGHTYGSGN